MFCRKTPYMCVCQRDVEVSERVLSKDAIYVCVREKEDIDLSERVLSKDAHICVFSNDSSTCGCEREGRDVEASERVLSKDAIYVCVSERKRT